MNFNYISVFVSVLVSRIYGRRPPHIIFIVADDLGWHDVGWRNDKIHTPNLDKLARNGVILNSSYVLPICTPTRSAFMTGYYPFRTGLQHGVIDLFERSFLPERFSTLPEKLKPLGYTTHLVGKWHLGYCDWKYTPTYRGFDSFLGFYGGSEGYFTHRRGDHHERRYDFRLNEDVYHPPKNKYSTDVFADRAIDIINNIDPKTESLYLYLAFQSVHVPLEVPKRYMRYYRRFADISPNRRTYSAMVTALDKAVGKVTKALRSRGLIQNALLVFTTDNGGDVHAGGSNYPLRGGKSQLWEGGTRGTAFVYSDKLFEKTKYVNNEIIHAVDWFPTLISVAGGTPDSDLDGINQWQTISSGVRSSRQEFVYNIDEVRKYEAIRVGKYKLIRGGPPLRRDGSQHPGVQLYDLEKDPLERVNLSDQLGDKVEELDRRLAVYRKTMVRPIYGEEEPQRPSDIVSPGWCAEEKKLGWH